MFLDIELLTSSPSARELLGSAAAGAVAFPSVLAFAQVAVFKPLRITVASRLSPVFGAFSISLAGFTASLSAIKACSLIQESLQDGAKEAETDSKKITFSAPELVISTVSSVVIFRALGGRFSSVLPSHLFHPGAFARERIPAVRGYQLANVSEKNLIRDIGKRYGCHTCGKKQVSSFVCDHQPPSHLLKNCNSTSSTSSVAEAAGKVKVEVEGPSSNGGGNNGGVVRQFFYPQCYKCSTMQGGTLNGGNTSKAIISHPLSLRAYHAFLPVPFIIAYLKSNLRDEFSLSELSPSSSVVVKNLNSRSEVNQDRAEKETQTVKGSEMITSSQSSGKSTFRSLIQESDISHLVSNFPFLIVWQRAVQFLDSFRNPGDGFHIMLWAFVVVAAWGTV